MPLDILILALLHKTPASGLELHRKIREETPYIWEADLPQIYRALHRLEEDGSLISHEGPSKRGPRRRLYNLTDAGIGRLREWVVAGPALPPERIGYLAQVLAMGALNDNEMALEFFYSLKSLLTARLDTLRDSQRSSGKQVSDPSAEGLFISLSRDSAIAAAVAQLAWVARAIAQLNAEVERQRVNTPESK